MFWYCNHIFEEFERKIYLDYSGFSVLKITYRCKKCGKKKNKKYY